MPLPVLFIAVESFYFLSLLSARQLVTVGGGRLVPWRTRTSRAASYCWETRGCRKSMATRSLPSMPPRLNPRRRLAQPLPFARGRWPPSRVFPGELPHPLCRRRHCRSSSAITPRFESRWHDTRGDLFLPPEMLRLPALLAAVSANAPPPLRWDFPRAAASPRLAEKRPLPSISPHRPVSTNRAYILHMHVYIYNYGNGAHRHIYGTCGRIL